MATKRVLIEEFGLPEHKATFARVLTIPVQETHFPITRDCKVDALGELVKRSEAKQVEAFREYMFSSPHVEDIRYMAIDCAWKVVVTSKIDNEDLETHVNAMFERLTAWNTCALAEAELARRWYEELIDEQNAENDPLGLYDMDILL